MFMLNEFCGDIVQEEELFWKNYRVIVVSSSSSEEGEGEKYDWVKKINDETVVPVGGDGKQREFIAYAYVPEKMPI